MISALPEDIKARIIIVAAVFLWSCLWFALGRLGRRDRQFDRGFAEGRRFERDRGVRKW